MRNLHEHYEQLTPGEREFVDMQFRNIFEAARGWGGGIYLHGDDAAEVAVDALARLVIVSRPPAATSQEMQTLLSQQGTPYKTGSR